MTPSRKNVVWFGGGHWCDLGLVKPSIAGCGRSSCFSWNRSPPWVGNCGKLFGTPLSPLSWRALLYWRRFLFLFLGTLVSWSSASSSVFGLTDRDLALVSLSDGERDFCRLLSLILTWVSSILAVTCIFWSRSILLLFLRRLFLAAFFEFL